MDCCEVGGAGCAVGEGTGDDLVVDLLCLERGVLCLGMGLVAGFGVWL